MPSPTDIPTIRFRRAAFVTATLALLCFAWTIWMLLHFNAGPSGVRFGTGTMLSIASISLPGPVLLLFLGWHARYHFCRILGLCAILPVLAVCALPAISATGKLRPVFSPGGYDAAIREAELRATAALYGPTPAVTMLKSFRADFFTHRTTKDDYVALLAGVSAVRQQFEEHASQHAGGLHAVMAAPFDARSISSARRDEYLRLVFQQINPDLATQGFDRTLSEVRGFEARLKLLVDNWGKWRWENEATIRFDDETLNKSFEALPDAPTP